jgi:hypothetical protein
MEYSDNITHRIESRESLESTPTNSVNRKQSKDLEKSMPYQMKASSNLMTQRSKGILFDFLNDFIHRFLSF